MPALGSRGWQGSPELPQLRIESLSGNDVLLSLTFLNSASVPTQPTSISYRVDSLTSAQSVIPSTSVSPTGSTQVIQLTGASMQNTLPCAGREEFQVLVTAVVPDTNAASGSITVKTLVLIELVNYALPS